MILVYIISIRNNKFSRNLNPMIYPIIGSLDLIYSVIKNYYFSNVNVKMSIVTLLIGVGFSFLAQISIIISEYIRILDYKKKHDFHSLEQKIRNSITEEITSNFAHIIEKLNIKINLEKINNEKLAAQFQEQITALEEINKDILQQIKQEMNALNNKQNATSKDLQHVVNKMTNLFNNISNKINL
jgi:hypothetical protein